MPVPSRTLALQSWRLLFLCLPLLPLLASGCARTPAPVKLAVTPVTVVRDVVDAPLVTVTNVFDTWAERSRRDLTPRASGGWTIRRGFDAGIGVDFSYYLFKPVSIIFGVVTYIPCRSVWPNFPKGVSPWRKQDESWGSLYFPNTRALWRSPPEQNSSRPRGHERQAPPPLQERSGPPRGPSI